MKNCYDKAAFAAVLLLAFPLWAYSQKKDCPRAWEFGLGGAAMNLTRTMVSDFHQTQGGDYVFTLEEKLLYGGAEAYAAMEIKEWLYADLQGTFGLARYLEDGKHRQGYSIMAGPGVQFRPLVRSLWLQPYFRLGVNWYRKSFPTSYFGQFDGDVTKEAVWKAEDAWNKGYTFDANSFFPLSAGIGVIGWIGNRVGVRIQGQFLAPIGDDGANFAQASAGLVLRLGGRNKHKALADRYVTGHLDDYAGLFPERVVERDVVREVPVEVVKEVVKEIPCERTLAEMMDNINFDFDKATITAESCLVLDEIARTLVQFPDTRFLVAGYTDAKGTDKYNEKLSADRAKAVYDALLSRGVPASMLCHRGFGKRTAVVPASASDEQRRGDRKVVLERVTSASLWEYLSR